MSYLKRDNVLKVYILMIGLLELNRLKLGIEYYYFFLCSPQKAPRPKYISVSPRRAVPNRRQSAEGCWGLLQKTAATNWHHMYTILPCVSPITNDQMPGSFPPLQGPYKIGREYECVCWWGRDKRHIRKGRAGIKNGQNGTLMKKSLPKGL